MQCFQHFASMWITAIGSSCYRVFCDTTVGCITFKICAMNVYKIKKLNKLLFYHKYFIISTTFLHINIVIVCLIVLFKDTINI